MKLSLVLILIGTLLSSMEIIVGKVNLINFFANRIRFKSNRYIYRISQVMLQKGIEQSYFSKIGILLLVIGTLMQLFDIEWILLIGFNNFTTHLNPSNNKPDPKCALYCGVIGSKCNQLMSFSNDPKV